MDCHSWLLIAQAAKMNAAGIDAFASGESELAIHHLNSALVIINKLLLMHCDRYDLATQALDPRFKDSQGTPKTRRSRQRDDILARPTEKEIKALQDDRFYIYNQALIFTAPLSLADEDDDDDETAFIFGLNPYLPNASFREIRCWYIQVSFFWSIIHFNMALVLHKLIHETQEHNKRYREEAILFYKLCLQNLWVIPATSATMNLLMLSAVNNLAHVYLNLHTCCGTVVSWGCPEPAPRRSRSTDCPAAKKPKLSHSMLPPDLHLCNQTELIQGLLLRAIGKVIANDRSLSRGQRQQVTEMSVNHIVLSALSPCYVAAGA